MICKITKYYSGNQIENNKLSEASSTLWGEQILVEKSEGKRPHLRPRLT